MRLTTLLTAVLPPLTGFQIDQVRVAEAEITVTVHPRRRTARCPLCQRRARRVHSRYTRTVADLPWGGRPVRVQVQARRFRCDHPACMRQIFCERLADLAPVSSRQTPRRRTALERIGFASSGQVGARLDAALGLPASRMTLLRLVRATPGPTRPTPRVLGVDDWAWRKGQRYGTVLVDLERHCPVDLLPERTAEAFAAWLIAHPGVEVISRDRGGSYAEGGRQGAPQALQIADRFHLVKNAGDHLEQVVARHHPVLRQAAEAAQDTGQPPVPVGAGPEESGAAASRVLPSPGPSAPPSPEGCLPPPAGQMTREQRAQQERRARRVARYEQVRALRAEGLGLQAIGARLGLAPATVRRFARAADFPERKRHPTGRRGLQPYEAYLRERWMAGEHNAAHLWAEIRARGFTGAAVTVRRAVARWRPTPGQRGRCRSDRWPSRPEPAPPALRTWSPRQTRWLLLRHAAQQAQAAGEGHGAASTPGAALDAREVAYVERLVSQSAELATAQTLTYQFLTLVQTGDASALERWFTAVERSGLPELASFAAGLRRDRAAVEAALTSPWSNGQTEGAPFRCA